MLSADAREILLEAVQMRHEPVLCVVSQLTNPFPDGPPPHIPAVLVGHPSSGVKHRGISGDRQDWLTAKAVDGVEGGQGKHPLTRCQDGRFFFYPPLALDALRRPVVGFIGIGGELESIDISLQGVGQAGFDHFPRRSHAPRT